MTTAEALTRSFAEFKPRNVPDDQLDAVNATVEAWMSVLTRIRDFYADAALRLIDQRFLFAEVFDDDALEALGIIPLDLKASVVEVQTAEKQMGSTVYASYGLVTPADDAWVKMSGPEAAALKKSFDEWNLLMLGNVSDGQRARINSVLKHGLSNGWDRDMLVSGMQKVNHDGMPEWRLRMIAQTESIRAWNNQHVESILSAGGFVGLKWLDGQRGACPSCRGLDNKVMVFGVDRAFVDPIRGFVAIHPPLHPNCRCAIAGAIESDLAPIQQQNLAKKRELEAPKEKPLTPRELANKQIKEALPNADINPENIPTLEAARLIADAFTELAALVPGATKTLKSMKFISDKSREWQSERGGHVYAYVDTLAANMTFNTTLWADLETYWAAKRRDISRGWTAGRQGPKSTVIHEFGHILDIHRMVPAFQKVFDLPEEDRDEVVAAFLAMEGARKLMNETHGYVSDYAKTHPAEHFAEDFLAGVEGKETHKEWFATLISYNQILDKHFPVVTPTVSPPGDT